MADHHPRAHAESDLRYRERTHERILREAATFGDDTAALIDLILRSRPNPEQGFRSCIGILRMVSRYDAERVDAACARAFALGTRSYRSVVTILKNRQGAARGATIHFAPREHLLSWLLPLKGETIMIHPLAKRLRGLGLAAMASAFPDMRASRGPDRALFQKLAGYDSFRQSQHPVISGPAGVGNSWLACALGHKGCRDGFSVLYRRATAVRRPRHRLW